MHIRRITKMTAPALSRLTIGEILFCQLSIYKLGSADQCKQDYDDIPDCEDYMCE